MLVLFVIVVVFLDAVVFPDDLKDIAPFDEVFTFFFLWVDALGVPVCWDMIEE